MLAFVISSESATRLKLVELGEPQPAPDEALARISHANVAHRGAESAKVVVLQRLFAIQGERPDADRV